MGFWDSKVIDLHLAGIHLSEVEVDILENGGDVMCLAELPDPAAYQGGDWNMIDTSGRVVMVPIWVSAADPTSVAYTDHKGHKMTYAEHVDAEIGTDWRTHPAYVGELLYDDGDRWGQHFVSWAEEPRAYRPWACKPLVSVADKDLYARVQAATVARLQAADWDVVDEICYHEAGGDFVAETACVELGVVKPPRGWTDPYEGMFSYAGNEQYFTALCTDFARLCDTRRFFTWSWDHGDGESVEPFTIGAFEDYLEPGDVEAYQFWFSVVARRNFVHSRLKRVYHGGSEDFTRAERWIA